jgi:uncharacterized protein (UPF0261 family)
MQLLKAVHSAKLAAVFSVSVFLMPGCGGRNSGGVAETYSCVTVAGAACAPTGVIRVAINSILYAKADNMGVIQTHDNLYPKLLFPPDLCCLIFADAV